MLSKRNNSLDVGQSRTFRQFQNIHAKNSVRIHFNEINQSTVGPRALFYDKNHFLEIFFKKLICILLKLFPVELQK